MFVISSANRSVFFPDFFRYEFIKKTVNLVKIAFIRSRISTGVVYRGVKQMKFPLTSVQAIISNRYFCNSQLQALEKFYSKNSFPIFVQNMFLGFFQELFQ